MSTGPLAQGITVHDSWRRELAGSLDRYGQWLSEAGLEHAASTLRIDAMRRRLKDDRITVAFVAEFSRGKSELINAIFFPDYGQRVLPSSVGRTTMCPTELMYDPGRPASIRLLPIETRLRDTSLAELRDDASAWQEIAIQPGDRDSVTAAFAHVRETRLVSPKEAAALGLWRDDDAGAALEPDPLGRLEIPRWRHAIANIPDPLLAMGLVVIDTPGLNALGNEPELTLNLIPGADAVLFVLAADTGVTRSDIQVWRDHIGATHSAGRFVVLNKIDGLWDDLRDDVQIEIEIARQVSSVSMALGISPERVFPVSAQKGLVARVRGEAGMLRRSRLPDLERALSCELVAQRRTLVRERVRREFDELVSLVGGVLVVRRRGIAEQLSELEGLRGKNRGVVEQMTARIRVERSGFELSVRRLQALRAVVDRHAGDLHATVGIESLRRHVRGAREVMRSSNFSVGLRDGMASLVAASRCDFVEVGRMVEEVSGLMEAMYRVFATEHELSLGAPMPFSSHRYLDEIGRVEALYRREFGARSLVTTEKWALVRRFFESVAARIREIYENARREIEAWLRAVLAPIEGQVGEHQVRLRRRLDSVRRVIDASGSLNERIADIELARAHVDSLLVQATCVVDEVRAVLDRSAVEQAESAQAQ